MTRLRRSRQCRGSRARNYVRSLARTNDGSHLNNDATRLIAQASESGAIDSHRRAVERKIKVLRP